MESKYKNIFLSVVVCFCLALATSSHAANNLGDNVSFYANQNLDVSGRNQVTAELVKITNNLYFYIEKTWWGSQTATRQNEILANLETLSVEFSTKIYPTLTSLFGSEWKPGIDSDAKITVLLHSTKEGIGGYFRSNDEYQKLQVPDSNEREMLYLSLTNIDNPQLKGSIAHEFVHLITFNQKDRLRGVQEEVWLNEARADYASTILGYDDTYEGSNLQRRVRDFLQNPTDPLLEWQDTKYDYAVISVFMHYLTDHYSSYILSDSLKSNLIGIPSLNEALLGRNSPERFNQIFTNWMIATLINDCAQGPLYCYTNANLRNLKINPTLNFLPLSGNSSLSVYNIVKNWAGNWQKIIGGNGDLRVDFSGSSGLNFQVPYVIVNRDGSHSITFLNLNSSQKGQISVKNFGGQVSSLILMPSLQSKITGFDGSEEPAYPYAFTASIGSILNNQSGESNLCSSIPINLALRMKNETVKCLQQFLKLQGPAVYPEGLVTGYFGSLTKSAAVRFQKKYGIPQTGFVGPLTRAKINQLLNVQ